MLKNAHYTFDYFQPKEYHFSLDSIFLAQEVAKIIKESKGKKALADWKVLDLCSGCGIIGLELSLHSRALKKIDFLEVQEVYLDYFLKNKEMIYPTNEGHNKEFHFYCQNYQEIIANQLFENQYDLIISNPPYFFKGEGLLSPNTFKNRCRFFIDSNFETLILSTLWALRPGSSAYLLIRSGTNHGRTPIDEINGILKDLGDAKAINNIRGTDLVEIRKKI